MFVAPPGYQPIYNPALPYLGPIYGGLRDGVSIYFQGTVPHHINRFFINLLCGESESSDIALHFNPRFDGKDKVVFNTCQNGSWESEEKVRSMPFSKGKAFEMLISATSHGYKIKVNGNEFHHFKHRIPMERVRAMHIAGDVSIQTINVIGGGYPGAGMGGGFPGMGGPVGGQFPGPQLPGMSGQPIYSPPMPFSSVVPGGMFPKRTVVIRGLVPYGGEKLSINFLVSRSRDIAFHLNPRVKEGIVVRNSMIGGCWGQEERELSLSPFVEGQYFDVSAKRSSALFLCSVCGSAGPHVSVLAPQMSIRCGNGRFKVFVNGQHLFDFVHRFQSCGEIDMLEIGGDVQISYIHF
ncbi:galectin-4-like isoform X3 [Betta splendens]|uniref:Galectin n=1 Tax=Betta splendens TaxID=158456 RepID=A0A9W2Y6Z7_BETSP|nr:galectin-4-like isoform X3 [Betta splendens]